MEQIIQTASITLINKITYQTKKVVLYSIGSTGLIKFSADNKEYTCPLSSVLIINH